MDKTHTKLFRRVLIQLPFYLLALTMIFPYYWMTIGAFKPSNEVVKYPPTFVIEHPTLANYYNPSKSTVSGGLPGLFQYFESVPLRFGTFFLNSVIISSSITILSLIVASAAAYVLAKHDLPEGHVMFLAILASMMIPWQVTLIPNFLLVKSLGWLNTYWGYIIPALPKAFAVFFLRQYMLSLPDDLLDAARIDGASEIRIWWQIILPLVKPALAAMTIFIILNEWNNFVWPLIVAQKDNMATLTVAISRLLTGFPGADRQGVLMAASLLASIPTVIVFLVFQKHFIKGIALTGLKS